MHPDPFGSTDAWKPEEAADESHDPSGYSAYSGADPSERDAARAAADALRRALTAGDDWLRVRVPQGVALLALDLQCPTLRTTVSSGTVQPAIRQPVRTGRVVVSMPSAASSEPTPVEERATLTGKVGRLLNMAILAAAIALPFVALSVSAPSREEASPS